MGGDTQLRPITSPDQPGLPNFSHEMFENVGRSEYEAVVIGTLDNSVAVYDNSKSHWLSPRDYFFMKGCGLITIPTTAKVISKWKSGKKILT